MGNPIALNHSHSRMARTHLLAALLCLHPGCATALLWRTMGPVSPALEADTQVSAAGVEAWFDGREVIARIHYDDQSTSVLRWEPDTGQREEIAAPTSFHGLWLPEVEEEHVREARRAEVVPGPEGLWFTRDTLWFNRPHRQDRVWIALRREPLPRERAGQVFAVLGATALTPFTLAWDVATSPFLLLGVLLVAIVI